MLSRTAAAAAVTDDDDEEEFPDTDIVKALGVELEDHDDAEPDEIDHSDE